MANSKEEQLRIASEKLGLGTYKRHVFLCTGPTCCSPEEGQAAWDALKQGVKDHELHKGEQPCYRTKVGCLRICCQGPTLVVYPEGTWYHGMSAERIPRFVEEHLVGNRPVEEWIFARNPINAGDVENKGDCTPG